jgi:penicillin-binding protein 2
MAASLGKSHDPQRYRGHHRLALVLLAVGVLALLARLALVQLVRGERYQKYAVIERVTRVRAQAPRGLIKAADGTVLARNLESHSLEILTNRVKPERVEAIVATLRELLDVTDTEEAQWLDELRKPVDPRKKRPLTVRRDLVSNHCPYDSTALELTTEHIHRFCTTCGRHFETPPAKRTCPGDQRRLLDSGQGNLHCAACERDFFEGDTCPYDGGKLHADSHVLHCPLCRRTFNDEVAVLRANLHRLPEARVNTDIQREYPLRYLASHVLGYMGYVSPADLEPQFPFGAPRYGLNDRVGRSGIERALDETLRGIDGEQLLVKRGSQEEQAKDLDELTQAMQPRAVVAGPSVRLTLDLELQRSVKTAMKDVYSGAAVVLDAHTGDVLAMYAKPSFDPNTLSGKRGPKAQTLDDVAVYAPLINKALHGFPPASTYKTVSAIAALEDGAVTPKTDFGCGGHYDYGGRRFHCHRRSGHGSVELYEALQVSCDVYFYHVGELLGLERLDAWARHLGFGEPTGIEIRESIGRVPTRDWYRRHVPGGYFPGFALSTAVGQKDVLATPLQLARLYAALGNGGTLPRVSIVAGFEDAQGKLVPAPRQPGRSLGLKKSTMQQVRAALYAVVNEEGGTAYTSQPTTASMAGKTGTAQAPQRMRKEVAELYKDDAAQLQRLTAWLQNDHSWFAGWAPWSDAQIAVVVLVEHGGSGGHNAAPIAKQIVDAWFSRHTPPAEAEAPPKRPKRVAPAVQPDGVAAQPASEAPASSDPGPSEPAEAPAREEP